MKMQSASCVLQQAILPIHVIYLGTHNAEIDAKFIGFRHGELPVIRVRRPSESEYAIMNSVLPEGHPSIFQYWILVHGETVYRQYVDQDLQFVMVEIWELDK